MPEIPYIAVSGGFDPVHGGHLDYLEAAATYAKVLVLLNSDEWLIRKKGYCFMQWEERARILNAMEYVSEVFMAHDDDDTVKQSLYLLGGIKYFGKGGDRTKNNTPEDVVCKELGIKVIYGLGGNKIQSSSQLVANAKAYH